MVVKAKTENVDILTDYANEVLSSADCPMKVQFQIDIAIDEIFSNIALYAYEGKTSGDAEMTVEIEGSKATLTFSDSGIPFNPLEATEPDISLDAEERKIGGLGIFMVRKSMDSVSYKYENGHNILTLVKTW